MRLSFHSEPKKQYSITDPKHNHMYLQQVKSHYEIHDENPEMTKKKLLMLTTLAMDISMKIKWFERWKSSHAHREALKFLKPKFNDIEFSKWPYKATWWAQVIIFLSIIFCSFNFHFCLKLFIYIISIIQFF